jgi:hypothetical protein
MQLTPHFSTAEFERSQSAARAGIPIRILPGTDVWLNLAALCERVLEPLRAQIGKPIIVSSGYRPEAVNDLVGGAPNSQHTLGQAADIVVHGISDYDLATTAAASKLPFDQLIYEFGRWVHLSHDRHRPPRGAVLTAYADAAGKTHYAGGIRALGTIEGANR